MPFFILFFFIPLIEIALFIEVGAQIGLGTTLAACFLTALIGGLLVRHQGLAALFSARRQLDEQRIPLNEVFDGLCLAVAGALLMTPGFFTDTIGFLLLIPAFRRRLQSLLKKHFQVRNMAGGPMDADGPYENANPHDTGVIEGEYARVGDKDEDQDNPPPRD